MFSMLKEHGDYVLVTPRIIPLTLKRVGRRFFRRNELHDVLADSPVPSVIAAIRELVLRVPHAYHLVTVMGAFQASEVRQIKQHVRAFVSPGQIMCVINPMQPIVSASNAAEYLLCDFAVGPEPPQPVTELLETTTNLSGKALMSEIEEALKRMREVRRR